jgi:Tol biopolymer transport system component
MTRSARDIMVLLGALAWWAGRPEPSLAQPAAEWDVTQPRGRTREIDFTTDQGTWMSVDISPDLRWIVFDLLGHIYRVSAGGGEAESLTQGSGIAVNFHPRISPDGRAIAFISDRAGQENLWVMSADGSDARPVSLDADARMAEPAWTPDGRFILAARRAKTPSGFYRTADAIWRFPRSGGRGLEVVRLGASGATVPARAGVWVGDDRLQWPAMSPDGRYVYFHSSLFAGDNRRLRRLDLSTKAIEDVTESKGGYLSCCGRPAYPLRLGEIAPEPSPDGRWLAFARKIPGGLLTYRGKEYMGRTALWVRDLAAGTERVVMDPITTDYMDLHPAWTVKALPGYSWARDGRSIVLSQGGRLRRVWIETGKVETIPFRARVRRTISEMARGSARIEGDSFAVRSPRWPASSPDGKTLVFEAVGRLWRMDLPAGAPRLLTTTAEGFELTPDWSPDGQWITFATWDDDRGGQVWRVAARGGTPERVTREAGTYLHPIWTPDGAILVNRWPGALTRTLDDSWDLVRTSAAGESEVLSRNGPLYMSRPSPDGRLFAASRGAGATLTSSSGAGTDPRQHLTVPGATSEMLPSPDGRWLAIRHRREIYIAAFSSALVAGSPLRLDLDAPPPPEVKRITVGGAAYPRWRNAGTLEFFAANQYLTHDPESGRTDTTAIRLTVPRDVPPGAIALRGARIVTLADRRVINRGTVVVRRGRISCVGDCRTDGVDRVVDVSGATIVPGFVDVHAHDINGHDEGLVPQHRSGSARYLAYGVTTTHDPSAAPEASFAVGELVEAGRIVGPRTFSTGPALTCGDWSVVHPIRSFAEAAALVNGLADRGALSIKDYKQCTRTQRTMLAEAARRRGVSLTSEGSDLFYLLGLVMTGHAGFEHAIQVVPQYGDVTRFLGQAGAHHSPQLILSDYPVGNAIEYWFGQEDLWANDKVLRWTPWQEVAARRSFVKKPAREFVFPILAEGAADLVRAGGYVAIGAHGEQVGLDTHWEVWSLGAAATPMEALESASLHGAHFLGLERDIGSIEVGKLGDLMVLDANPLENIRNTASIRYVMKAGKLFDASTLEELWPTRRPYGTRPWSLEDAVRRDARSDDHWDRPRP